MLRKGEIWKSEAMAGNDLAAAYPFGTGLFFFDIALDCHTGK